MDFNQETSCVIEYLPSCFSFAAKIVDLNNNKIKIYKQFIVWLLKSEVKNKKVSCQKKNPLNFIFR